MDYKHIEALLERYWDCETSPAEEQELKTFFSGNDVPQHLQPYRDLFVYQHIQQHIVLGDDFDRRIKEMAAPVAVKVKRKTLLSWVYPAIKVAAMVVVILSVGSLLVYTTIGGDRADYDYESYTDTYDDPGVAYEKVSSALMMLSEGINKAQVHLPSDSIPDDNLKQIKEL